MPLINCEVSLTLKWCENYVLTDITEETAAATQGDIQQDEQHTLQQMQNLK